MSTKEFECGDYVWVDRWHYRDIEPQIGLYVCFNKEHFIILYDGVIGGAYPYIFYDSDKFRLATAKEIDNHLKKFMP